VGGGHTAQMEKMRKAYKILFRRTDGKRPQVDIGIDASVILKLALNK
jgi:hypothetical protein